MHPNFYHWHGRVDLKPDPSILLSRWNAAAKVSEAATVSEIYGLLKLSLLEAEENAFSRKFSEDIVKIEPTFPISQNLELLRVMAAASLFTIMEKFSSRADAVALGIRSGIFLSKRSEPVCGELVTQANDYIFRESNRLRPNNTQEKLRLLKEKMEEDEWDQDEGAAIMVAEAVVELGDSAARMAEESQLLWWMVGKQSSFLGVRRAELTQNDYAMPAAVEAAERVGQLPPPLSVEETLGEVLSHCKGTAIKPTAIATAIEQTSPDIQALCETNVERGAITPLISLIALKKSGVKIEQPALQQLKISAQTKVVPSDLARQLYREMVFVKAMEALNDL